MLILYAPRYIFTSLITQKKIMAQVMHYIMTTKKGGNMAEPMVNGCFNLNGENSIACYLQEKHDFFVYGRNNQFALRDSYLQTPEIGFGYGKREDVKFFVGMGQFAEFNKLHGNTLPTTTGVFVGIDLNSGNLKGLVDFFANLFE